jgi:hypothetical protein
MKEDTACIIGITIPDRSEKKCIEEKKIAWTTSRDALGHFIRKCPKFMSAHQGRGLKM